MLPANPVFTGLAHQFAYPDVLSGRIKKIHPDTVTGFVVQTKQIVLAVLGMIVYKFSRYWARNKPEAGWFTLKINKAFHQAPVQPDSPMPAIRYTWQCRKSFYLVNQPRKSS